MVIAIDGPAGAGKSTIARILSKKLGYAYIETGAMYRAVALIALRRGIPLDDERALEAIAAGIDFGFEPTEVGNRIIANGEDITALIRTPEITQGASIASAIPGVRRILVDKQRELGQARSVIMEGRDIGTKVFPNAEVKVFLDASELVRSERRLLQEDAAAANAPEADRRARLERLQNELKVRDARDRQRAESPLVQAPDAIYLDSSLMGVEDVVAAILRLVEQKAVSPQSRDVSPQSR